MNDPYWETNIKPLLEEFSQLSSIKKYKYIENIRNLLKEIQKLSFRINQFERKFPFDTANETQYQDLLKAYFEFLVEIRAIDQTLMIDLF